MNEYRFAFVKKKKKQFCTVICFEGPKPKTLHIIRLESKVFFLHGVNQKSLVLQGGKHLLTLF